MLFGLLSGEDTTGRIKVGGGTMGKEASFVFHDFSAYHLAKARACGDTFLVVVVLSSVFGIAAFNFFRRRYMGAVVRLSVISEFDHFNRIGSASRQIRYLGSMWIIVLICVLWFCGFLRDYC